MVIALPNRDAWCLADDVDAFGGSGFEPSDEG